MSLPRFANLAAVTALALALAGCAAMNTLSADVSSFGEWPAARTPGRYAFERLPSQQARADEQQQLEAAAQAALARAGFQPVADTALADVLVQLGTRASRAERSPWDDPLWWRGGRGYGRYGPWLGSRWSLNAHWNASLRQDHEVAVLIRDRASGKPLYEARAVASSTRHQPPLDALFEAALKDFPRPGINPRRVDVQTGG